MQAALSLLILAQSLLGQVQSTPNLPEDFRKMAIQTANIAISRATEELTTYGSTNKNMPTQDEPLDIVQTTELYVTTKKVEEKGSKIPFYYLLTVSVMKNGVPQKGEAIEMIAPDNLFQEEWALHRKTNARTHNQEDWSTTFTYQPTENLNRVTIKYKDIEKNIILDDKI